MRTSVNNFFRSFGLNKLLYLLILSVLASCSTWKLFSPSTEDEGFFISRKYIGVFLDYRQTGPADLAGPNLIWIKTSMEDEFGKISAYGKKCDFKVGERLYLRRILYDPGIGAGYWNYYIENDSAVSYKATEFQHDHKIFTETIFK
jgi:hypothetical protein